MEVGTAKFGAIFRVIDSVSTAIRSHPISAAASRPALLRILLSSLRRLEPTAASVALIASPSSLLRKHRPIR